MNAINKITEIIYWINIPSKKKKKKILLQHLKICEFDGSQEILVLIIILLDSIQTLYVFKYELLIILNLEIF